MKRNNTSIIKQIFVTLYVTVKMTELLSKMVKLNNFLNKYSVQIIMYEILHTYAKIKVHG